uniref:Uncharacterized protein n=1 Tax=Timema bartmani TaxID=61472 RepID=A0A7R9ERW0_9NEOP|nr:unnamed protein product [Timema bartmani]
MRDLNLDLPVLGSLAQHETSALANYATEVAVLAGVAFHLNYLHLKEKLDLWHSPETLDSIKGLGTMTLIGGLTGVIWYIFIALYKSIPILPVSNSAAIMAVWAFMMAKWGLILILYGNKYIHIVTTSHRPLINQAVTSHRPLIEA